MPVMPLLVALFAVCHAVAYAQITSAPPSSNPQAPVIPPRQAESARVITIERNPRVQFDVLRKRSPFIDQMLGLPRGWPEDGEQYAASPEAMTARIERITPV